MTSRTIVSALASLALAFVVSTSVSAAPAAKNAPRQVRDVRTLPTLTQITTNRAAVPLNAIVSTSDTFLVRGYGFDDLQGSCQDRGWSGEDRSSQIYAHVSGDKTVNEAFFTGLAPAGGTGDNFTGRAESMRLWGGTHLSVTDSGSIIFSDDNPSVNRLLELYPATGTIRIYAENLPAGIECTAWDPVGKRLIMTCAAGGLYAATGNTEPPVLLGGLTGVDQDTTLAAIRIRFPIGVAVDPAGNIYYADSWSLKVRQVRTDGRVVTIAGTGGSGSTGDGGPATAAALQPSDLALDPDLHVLYVYDMAGARIRSIDLLSGRIDAVVSPLDGAGFIHLGASGGQLYAAFNDTTAFITRFMDGQLVRVAGTGTLQLYGAASERTDPMHLILTLLGEMKPDGAGGLYFVGNRLVFHLTAAGELSAVAGIPASMDMGARSLWFGADSLSAPEEVARWVRPSGYGNGWSQRLTSPSFTVTGHRSAVLRFDGTVHLENDSAIGLFGNNDWVQIQILNSSGTWEGLAARLTVASDGTTALQGPFIGYDRFKAEVHLDLDGNESIHLGATTRLRVIVQTENTGSSEDGQMSHEALDGALVVDNLTLRDGDLDLLLPTDFEDGTTGKWTLSALNGDYQSGAMVNLWQRDYVVDPTEIELKSGFDFIDRSCVWTFLAAGDTLNHRGLYASVTSPWLPLDSDPQLHPLLIAFSGKLGTINSGRLMDCWVRGKMAGDTRPRFAYPTWFSYHSGTWGEDVASPYIQHRVLSYPIDFQVNEVTADSVQIVFTISELIEGFDPMSMPPGTQILLKSKLPLLDDLRVYQLGVDRDHDGVADAADACPDSCAAGQDANADGCVDATATMRHVESWDRSALPLHYTISAAGDPRIADGSDIAAIVNGFAAWSAVPGTSLQVVRDPATSQTNASAYDGVNLVTFQDDYIFPPNVIAITPTLSALRRTTYDDRIVLPGQIVDADLIFNPSIPLRTSTYTPGGPSFDLQSVVTHEAGHVFGLSHSGVLRSTMFFVLQSGTGAASLEADDQAAIRAAYPGPSFATEYATISGQVTRGGTGYAIPGALVTAVSLDHASQPADSVASDYTDEGGNYALRGLVPGSYSVRVTPLDGEVGGYALTPDYISDRLDAVAQTNFAAEWWCEPESDRDTDASRGAITLAAGEVRSGVNVITNVDTIAPVVVSVSPAADTTDVRIDTAILVNFSERVDKTSLQGSVRLHEATLTNALGLDGVLVNGGRSMVLTPTMPLKFGTPYQLDLTTGLADREGVHLAAPYTTAFTTQAAPPVAITNIQPRMAAVGSFITIVGTSFDPAGTDSVEFQTPVIPYYLRVPAGNVTPTSMVVRVPSSVIAANNVRVEVNGEFSNPFGLTTYLPPPLTAPSHVTDVSLSFAPTDVAVAPDGAHVYAVGSGGIASIDLSNYQVSYGSIGAAWSIALSPDGGTAVVTRPAAAEVLRVDAGTLVPLGTTTLDSSAEPRAVTLAPNGRAAYVADPSLHVVYKIDVDAQSSTRDHVLAELADSAATITGGLAVSADGTELLYGSNGAGTRRLFLANDSLTAISSSFCSGGVAASPGGFDVFFAGIGPVGYTTGLLRDAPGYGSPTTTDLGGNVRDVAFTPDGRAVYVVNAGFSLLQVVADDTTDAGTFGKKVAEVGTGSMPVAIGVNGFGDLIAVANFGSHSISLYRTGGQATLVQAFPGVARPGDVVALQGSGSPFGAGSSIDLGIGLVSPGRTTSDHNGAAFVVPAGPQRDASVSVVDSSGMRTLNLPFRIVDPVATPAPHETGFGVQLDQINDGGGGFYPTAISRLELSPNGRVIAVVRDQATYNGVRLDFVLVGEDGLRRVGAKLYSGIGAMPGDQVLGAAFSSDGKLFWTCATDLRTAVRDADPSSPGFGTTVNSWYAPLSGAVGPIAADPLGRYMVMGDYSTNDSLHVFTPMGDPVGAIYVPATTHAIAVSPDGHYVVSAGTGHVNFGDLDNLLGLPGPPTHNVSTSASWDLAITLDGKHVVARDPASAFGVYNLSPTGGAIGAELYYGTLPRLPVGTDLGTLQAAPDGHRVLLSLPGEDSLAIIDPTVNPPSVTKVGTYRPIGPMVLSADGQRLWTETARATDTDSLRLVSLGSSTSLALVAGGGQSGLQGTWLPQALRFRLTDAVGNPQTGVVLRFDGVSGLLPILDSWDCPLWHITDANGEVSVKWRLHSGGAGTDSLVVTALGSSAPPVLVTAEAVLADNELPPRVVALGPTSGAADLNTTTPVSVAFNKAMDSTSVAAGLRLYVGPNALAGSLSRASGGKTWVFQPAQALAYAARCSLVVSPAITDTYGLTTTDGATSVFTVQAPPTLSITSLSPPAGTASTPVVITGQGLSPVPSQNTVLFNGVLATVTSATSGSVVATVPLAATSGPVTVQAGNATSNSLAFVVLDPAAGPGGVIGNLPAAQGVREIAITSDGARAYVTNPASNSVQALDIAGARTITNITVGLQPQGIALLPDDSRAYVANTGSDNVSVIDIRPTSTHYHEVVATIGVGAAPKDIAVSALGPKVVVANSGSNEVSIIDANPGNGTFDQVVGTVNVGSGGQSVTIRPDGTQAFVATAGGTLVTIDLGTDAVVGTVNLGSGGQSVTIRPDGTVLFVLCQDGTIKIIDIGPQDPKQYKVVGTVNVGSGGQSVTIRPDGAILFVTNSDGTVLAFSITASNVPGAVTISPSASVVLTLVATIPVGDGPAGIATSPTGSFLLVCNSVAGTVSIIGVPSVLPPVEVAFDFDPNTLNLKSMGKWVTGYIEPQPPHTAAEIDRSTIRVNGVVPADASGPAEIGDHDADGVPDLLVKFDRAAVSLSLADGASVPVTVTGTVGTRLFTGTDFIKVTRAKITSPHAREIVPPAHAYTVRWEVPKDFDGTWIAILHTFDRGETWVLDATHLANAGSYVWNVPAVAADSARIGIVLVESADSTGTQVEGVLSVSEPFEVYGATSLEPPPAVLTFAPIAPNPASGHALLRFGLPRAADVRLEIFDLLGRRVSTPAQGRQEAGWHDVTWSGRLENGSRIGAGLYFVRFRAEGREFKQRLIWLK